MNSLNRDQWKEENETRLVKIYRILEAHVKRLEDVRWGSMAFTAELSETRHQLNKMFDSEMAIVTAKHHSELEKVRQETIKECLEALPIRRHITKWKRHPQAEDGEKWCCYDGCEACARTQGGEFGFNDCLDQATTALTQLAKDNK